MSKFTVKHSLMALALGLAMPAFTNAQLADSTGTIDVTITLTEACQIASASPEGSSINLGTMDFGSTTTLDHNAPIESEINGFTVQCSAATAPKFTLASGLNDDTNNAGKGSYNHAMKHVSEDLYVGYNLYADASRATAISTETPFFTSKNDGSEETVMLYGKAELDANGSYLPGVYNDTVTINIAF